MARTFVDRNQRATLKITTYTDDVVGEISLQSGISSHLDAERVIRAKSRTFDPFEKFGNWHALKLGSTESEVTSNLGTPARVDADGLWHYEARCVEDLPQTLSVQFKNGRVHRVVFSAPAG